MKKLLKVSFLACLTFVLVFCQNSSSVNENNLSQSTESTNNKSTELNSNLHRGMGRAIVETIDFDSISNFGNEFAGICIKLNAEDNREVEFYKVLRSPNEQDFKNLRVNKLLNQRGEHVKAKARRSDNQEDDLELIDDRGDFEFAYFSPWEILPILIKKKKLVVSGSNVNFGSTDESLVRGQHFTFKIEGSGPNRNDDFEFGEDINCLNTFMVSNTNRYITLPLFQTGLPCPPTWPPNSQVEIRKANKDFMGFIDTLGMKLKEID